ncbi:MAG TPA: zinc-dependent alcohol dehydrogenase family protein [Methylovirgula sp.]|nr:zinc-dependent alcohol dehydrogenase family protein [Methylovirgula sp.]
MQAMVLKAAGEKLRWQELPDPEPQSGEIRIAVSACGVCRTDLHVVDGELPHPKLPIIPGHEIVGRIDALGADVKDLEIGMRVGVPWLGHTCGHCAYCLSGHENLCDAPLFTGYTRNGGYATRTVADVHYVFPLGDDGSDQDVAPLLCAGLIGWRSLVMAGDGRKLGLYGFGAAAHIIAQVARFQGREVFAFTSPGDRTAQDFARRIGAVWAGGSDEKPPEPLDAAIIYAPVGPLVPRALAAVKKGGTVVCAGIHMSDIPSFPYDLLWEERRLVSVANLTRKDGIDFLRVAADARVITETTAYPLARANEALDDLRHGRLNGAAVLIPPRD